LFGRATVPRFSGATLGRQGEQQKLLLRLILMGDWCDFYAQPTERKNGCDSMAVRGNVNAVAWRLCRCAAWIFFLDYGRLI
jgi:hypothetical protein